MSNVLLDNAIILITGAHMTGKSTLAHTYTPPDKARLKRVFCQDSERSANRIIQEMGDLGFKLGHYGSLQEQFYDLPEDNDLLSRIAGDDLPWKSKEEKDALVKYYKYILSELDTNLTRDDYDVYILDTVEKFEAGMVGWCEEHIKEFGYNSIGQAMKMASFWTKVFYPLYDQFFSSIFARGVKTIILVSHLHTVWVNRKPVPGKVKPSGKPRLSLLTSFTLWLVPEPDNSEGDPAGIVIKERLGKLTVVGDRWKPRRMIPERIPVCNWVEIERYLEEGCNLSDPRPGETMKDSERQMIQQWRFSDDQMKLMILDAEQKLEETKHNGHPESIVQTVQSSTFSLPTEDPLVAEWRVKAHALGESDPEIVRGLLLNTLIPPLRMKGPAFDAITKVVEEMKGQ